MSATLSPPSVRSADQLDLERFEIPPVLEASAPPEARGLRRDEVRMLVAAAGSGRLDQVTFSELPEVLAEGDLVVVNTSATLPAAVTARRRRPERVPLEMHLSTQLPGGLVAVELRSSGRPFFRGEAGETLDLPAGATLVLLAPYSLHRFGVRLWVARLQIEGELHSYLGRHGTPIRYPYVRGSWPLSDYQNVYASEAGSAEMASAGRPFTPEVITRLVARGISVSPIVLHTGVASLESFEPPYPEQYRVPAVTASRVNAAHREGGRVIAVGTTVVRALETVVDGQGWVHAGSGWTETIITPERRVASVDGLLTGWHEPAASHLAMLEAIGGRELLRRSYTVALEEGYLWHEFGDVHLLLP